MKIELLMHKEIVIIFNLIIFSKIFFINLLLSNDLFLLSKKSLKIILDIYY